jgi:hypothetical protein
MKHPTRPFSFLLFFSFLKVKLLGKKRQASPFLCAFLKAKLPVGHKKKVRQKIKSRPLGWAGYKKKAAGAMRKNSLAQSEVR